VGPVSAQALVEWRLGEWGDKFIGVCTEANSVMGAEAADFFFYWWYSEVLADDWVWHVPGGINYFDWKHSNIAMLEFEVVPQSWMPYVQTGLSIAL
jgi:hypothetical protein